MSNVRVVLAVVTAVIGLLVLLKVVTDLTMAVGLGFVITGIAMAV